jgi:hypothetical protein
MEHLNKERAEIVESRRAAKVVQFRGFPTDLSPSELYDMRAKTAQQIRSVVERVELYRPNLAKACRQAGIEHPLKNDPDSRFDRNFMVRFKGGASRLIYPDSSDAFETFKVVNLGFPMEQRDKLPNGQSRLPHATRTAEEFRMAREER